jgi:competence protein ComFC
MRHDFIRHRQVTFLAKRLIKLLFPHKCIFCGTVIDYERDIEICDSCFKKVPFVSRINYEVDCSRHYDRLICLCRYTGIVKECLIRFKFYEKASCYRTFAKLISGKLKDAPEWDRHDMIMSVPLHPRKQRLRGYNQSLLISKSVSRETGIQENSPLLLRTRETDSQSLLARDRRYSNVRGAFKIKSPEAVTGKSVLLVDDIFTTGYTINECARVLKNAGAVNVTALVIATGRR